MHCFICEQDFETVPDITVFVHGKERHVSRVEVDGSVYEPCQACLRPFIAGILLGRREEDITLKGGSV